MSGSDPRPFLVLPNGSHHPLSGNCSIGRTKETQICLEGANVSRQHAYICEIAGNYQLIDAQSRNGTYLNDTKITRPTILRVGDCIGIGAHRLRFMQPEKTEAEIEAALSDLEQTIQVISSIECWLLLVDIIQSTQLLHQLGAVAYAEMLGTWFGQCRFIIEKHGGEINKNTGDGFLAFWRTKDQAKDAVILAALADFQALRGTKAPAFRIVSHVGQISVGGAAHTGEEALAGAEVHKLFRIEKFGTDAPNSCTLTAEAADRLKKHIPVTFLGEFELKGFAGLHGVYSGTLGS